MKRAYYTDPLAAAWMAKHFGMKFWGDRPGHGAFLPEDEILKRSEEMLEKEPLNVHPDSLHLLEVREDDQALFEGGKILRIHAVTDANRGKPVVLRDGIPFMWPVFEE